MLCIDHFVSKNLQGLGGLSLDRLVSFWAGVASAFFPQVTGKRELDLFVRLCAFHQTISFHAINRASKKASRITHPRLNSSTSIRSDLQFLFYAIFSPKTAPLYCLFTRSQPTTCLCTPLAVVLFDSRTPPARPRRRKRQNSLLYC